MYQIKLTKQAEKAFDRLMQSQPKMGQRVANAIDLLASNPTIGIPLKGELKGCFKYRIGSYRIIYQIQYQQLTVFVIDIGDRKDVYR